MQAFPGAASRFLSPEEAANFTRNFGSLMIWGLGATCLSPTDNTTQFPAFCGSSWCQCLPPPLRKAPLEAQRFVTNMDGNLQAQGAALKAAAAAQGRAVSVLGYIDHTSPQQYFANQNALREDPSLAVHLARLESLGGAPIDCMSAARGNCCEQGSEFSIYNFSNPATVAYYAEKVVGALIDGPGLDGTFLDSIDWPLTFGCGASPGHWVCTPAEKAALVRGTLDALDAALAYSASRGKLLSVSSHNSLGHNAEYYLAQLALLAGHGNGWRFYESFEVSPDSLATYLFEAQGLNVSSGAALPATPRYAVPVMMHTYATPTMNPDWVELAAFLLGANTNSYFSCSQGWDIDSFPVHPEFARPLGAPLGPPTLSQQALPPWALIPGLNVVDSLPPSPGANASNAVFLGRVPTPADCAALARAGSFAAFTHTLDGSAWSSTCYARNDTLPARCFTAAGAGAGPPCFSVFGPGHASGCGEPVPGGGPAEYRREFEHLRVTLRGPLAGGGYGAELAWS